MDTTSVVLLCRYVNSDWRNSTDNVRIRVRELTHGELRMQVRLRGINVEQNLGFGEGSVCL